MLNLKKILITVPVAALALLLASCGGGKGDNNAHYDGVTKTLKLQKSYEGKSFIDDGIGAAKVAACTDGDTTRFDLLTNNGLSVVVRYHSIDTPESTGGVEKWGKAASLFNKGILTEATEVVLEATGPKAQHDSYGTRYLGYVWYRKSASEDFKLLNLEMVENGFSTNHGTDTSEFPYNSYFKKAEEFAKSKQLHLHSSEEDPLFSNDPIDITLKEFWENPEKFYNSDTQSGSKVRTELYLTDLTISNSGTYTFTGKQYDPETKEVKTINVYAGYASAAASGMPIGNLYTVIGSIQYYGGNYQISGLKYASLLAGPEHTVVKQSSYYVICDAAGKDMEGKFATKSLYGDVTVTAVNGNTFTGTAKRYNSSDKKFDEETTLTFTLSSGSLSVSVGDTVKVNGLRLDSSKDNITVLKSTDIVKK